MVSILNTDSTGKWEPTAKQEGCGGGKGGAVDGNIRGDGFRWLS